MLHLGAETLTLPAWLLIGAAAFQLVTVLYIFVSLRLAARDRAARSREMYGMMKKVEGLTAGQREHMLVQFDRMLDTMSVRLPTAVAAKASELVFETEQQILARLAELEPNLKDNTEAREKMERLIRSMEDLEETMVRIASDTVQQVMMESRRTLFEEEGVPLGPGRPMQ